MKRINKTAVSAVTLIVFCCVAMALIDTFLSPPYFLKSLYKAALFLICPAVWIIITQIGGWKQLFIPSKRGLLTALGIGFAVFIIIFGGYFLIGSFFDLSGITKSLTSKIGVDKDNFLFVALYISLVNSLLEEFFFRGFAFTTLLKSSSRTFAYIFSALAFSLYHVSVMIGWFGLPLYSLILISLFAGGLIFNYAREKSGNIYIPWMIHMFANFAINGIGLILFSAV